MVEPPEDKINFFNLKKGDLVSIHYESSAHIQRVLSKIKEKGAIPGIAINPAIPLYVLEDILDDIDFVLIMTVNPGYAGQKLIVHILEKIKKVRDFLDTNGYEEIKIQVDGNVSFENGKKMRDAGADIFVAGSSSIFKKDTEMGEAISILRNAIDR
jgi:ribulose-phosphate 3-epimerase